MKLSDASKILSTAISKLELNSNIMVVSVSDSIWIRDLFSNALNNDGIISMNNINDTILEFNLDDNTRQKVRCVSLVGLTNYDFRSYLEYTLCSKCGDVTDFFILNDDYKQLQESDKLFTHISFDDYIKLKTNMRVGYKKTLKDSILDELPYDEPIANRYKVENIYSSIDYYFKYLALKIIEKIII